MVLSRFSARSVNQSRLIFAGSCVAIAMTGLACKARNPTTASMVRNNGTAVDAGSPIPTVEIFEKEVVNSICSGALVNMAAYKGNGAPDNPEQMYVLTAAHCFFRSQRQQQPQLDFNDLTLPNELAANVGQQRQAGGNGAYRKVTADRIYVLVPVNRNGTIEFVPTEVRSINIPTKFENGLVALHDVAVLTLARAANVVPSVIPGSIMKNIEPPMPPTRVSFSGFGEDPTQNQPNNRTLRRGSNALAQAPANMFVTMGPQAPAPVENSGILEQTEFVTGKGDDGGPLQQVLDLTIEANQGREWWNGDILGVLVFGATNRQQQIVSLYASVLEPDNAKFLKEIDLPQN